MNSKLKAAIIGYGYMGEIRHRVVDQHLSNIFSLKIDVPSLDKKSAFTLLETPEDIESYSLKLKQCFFFIKSWSISNIGHSKVLFSL